MSFAAAYNMGAVDGLPPLVPSTDIYLLPGAAVTTISERVEADALTYKLSELSGVGSLGFGLRAEPRLWRLQCGAPNATARLAFESQLRRYVAGGKRYALQSERGDTWPYCVMRSWRYIDLRPIPGGGWYGEIEVVYEDLQPMTGV